MLNIISQEFRDKKYGSIPSPSERTNKEEILFMPHDSFPIFSNYATGGIRSERTPDIIGVFLSYLCDRYEGYGDYDFAAMAGQIAAGQIPREGEKALRVENEDFSRTEWKDVHLTVELKYHRKIEDPVGHWTKEDVMEAGPAKQVTRTTGQPMSNVRTPGAEMATVAHARTTSNVEPATNARLAAIESEPPNIGEAIARKRARVEEDINNDSERPQKIIRRNHVLQANTPINVAPLRPSTNIRPPPSVQCAYYASERLASSFFITHSIVVLIDGMATTFFYPSVH